MILGEKQKSARCDRKKSNNVNVSSCNKLHIPISVKLFFSGSIDNVAIFPTNGIKKETKLTCPASSNKESDLPRFGICMSMLFMLIFDKKLPRFVSPVGCGHSRPANKMYIKNKYQINTYHTN